MNNTSPLGIPSYRPAMAARLAAHAAGAAYEVVMNRIPGMGSLLRRGFGSLSVVRVVEGTTFQLFPAGSVVDFRLTACHYYEPEVSIFLDRHLRPGMHVIDVGANIGVFTAAARSRVGAAGSVTSFEPNPRNYSRLCKMISDNRMTGVTTVPMAVGEEDGRILMSAQADAALHSVVTTPGDAVLEVPMTSLDHWILTNPIAGPLSLIKIDIEGAEQSALLGMRRTLMTSPGVKLLIEVHEAQLAQLGTSLADFAATLRSFGFRIFNLERSGAVEDVTDRAERIGTRVICQRTERDEHR